MSVASHELPVGKILPHGSPQGHATQTAVVGMVIFLGSWAMMFAALFFVYAGIRTKAHVWPPLDVPALPVLQGFLNTLVIGASSALLHLGLRRLRRGHAGLVPWIFLATVLLGSLFLALQVDGWLEVYRQGLRPDSGAYASVFFGLTWLHAVHVLVGLVAWAWLSLRAFLGAVQPAHYLGARLWAMYWHFVGVVWLVLFVSVYVM